MKTIKRTLIIAAAVALLFALTVPALAFAAGGNGNSVNGAGLEKQIGRQAQGLGQGAIFVDADGDGICDNLGVGFGANSRQGTMNGYNAGKGCRFA